MMMMMMLVTQYSTYYYTLHSVSILVTKIEKNK
jgi:hypothetical protein